MVSRRQFLHCTALGTAGLTLAEPLLRRKHALWAAPVPDRTVVIVNLFGGNDGLNTLIPLGQYDRYRRMRPTLSYDRSRLDGLTLAGQPDFAVNPGLTALRGMYAQGKVAFINGVGVPRDANGLFDHAVQQEEFQTCDVMRDSSVLAPSGWLGRYLDGLEQGVVSPGIEIGGGNRLMLTGQSYDPLTVYSIRELELQISEDRNDRRPAYERVMAVPRPDNAVAERNRLIRLAGLAQSQAIRDAVTSYQTTAGVTYPNTWLGDSLQECAKIVYGNLGVCALAVGTGGYDTHGDQNSGGSATQLGYHDELLQDVGDSIKAFYDDLAGHGLSDRVLILTVSEFGRTPYENSDHGTDHGFSSVAMAVGDRVHGGIYGLYPSLAQQHLVFYDLTDVTTDFRSVYATAFANFLGADPVPLLGGNFPILGFL